MVLNDDIVMYTDDVYISYTNPTPTNGMNSTPNTHFFLIKVGSNHLKAELK
ncbi:hypothetical protein Hanom_Chr15g01380561 [Helianthus anomalus]